MRRVNVERDILRALCNTQLTRSAWTKVAEELRDYTWRDTEHGVVYAAIHQLGARGMYPKTLREQLPAQLTRLGFPDVDWRLYVSARKSAAEGAASILCQIKTALRLAQIESRGISRGFS